MNILDPNYKSENDSDYVNMINYLINTLNKAKSAQIPVQIRNKPVFLYEFFVFELYLPREILRTIRQPVLAFRLMDFPTLTLEGNALYPQGVVRFNQGKSSYFEMEISDLKENLMNYPMYIMFLDMNHGDMKIIGSSRLNISLFAYDNFLQFNGNPPKPRRNILKLFDNALEKVADFEMSLLIRREYYKYEESAFPRNEQKIIVEKEVNPNKTLQKNQNSKTSARAYTNDMRMHTTDEIMQSPHIRMTMEEKTKKDFYDSLQKADAETQVDNNIITGDILTGGIEEYKTEKNTSSNQTEAYKIPTEWKTSEQISVKDMMNLQKKNPPPLFYNNDPQNEPLVKVVKIIKEERKEGELLSQPISNSSVQTLNKSKEGKKKQTPYKPKERNFFIKPKKKVDEYSIVKKRYDEYMRNNSTNLRGSHKKIINTESIKIEENPSEEDSNDKGENKYIELYSQITKDAKSKGDKIEPKKEGASENAIDEDIAKSQKEVRDSKEKSKEKDSYGGFEITNENIMIESSNNNILQSMAKSNTNEIIESNINYESMKKSEDKKHGVLRSQTMNRQSIGNTSIKSIMESISAEKENPNKTKVITESSYNDFHGSSVDHQKDSNPNKTKSISEHISYNEFQGDSVEKKKESDSKTRNIPENISSYNDPLKNSKEKEENKTKSISENISYNDFHVGTNEKSKEKDENKNGTASENASYMDFHESIDEKLRQHTNETNRSQIVPEEIEGQKGTARKSFRNSEIKSEIQESQKSENKFANLDYGYDVSQDRKNSASEIEEVLH